MRGIHAAILIATAVLAGFAAGRVAVPVWTESFQAVSGQTAPPQAETTAAAARLRDQITAQRLSTATELVGQDDDAVRVTVQRHYGIWSVLPAVLTLMFCIVLRQPLPALLLGIVSGSLLQGRYDITDAVLLPGLASTKAAGITLLYLWCLGGILGIWSRTGAALAFADWVCQHFVRGPRSAKLVAWGLGILFFQGGTISTVLVGTTVRPITDRNRVSPEELSYIVDSTASPVASLIAFNAWPGYVQALIAVPGVAYLATESDRIAFFFRCTPLSFYSIFAVLGTLLLSIDRAPLLGKRFREAIARSRQPAAPEWSPAAAAGVPAAGVPAAGDVVDDAPEVDPDYRPRPWEFMIPLAVLIAIAVGTGIWGSAPQVRWAFAAAFVLAGGIALVRGMTLESLTKGVSDGIAGVAVASIILVLATMLGDVTTELGGGLYLSMAIGDSTPMILFPAALFVLTVVISFATGTSFGTYAIAYPLSMPLALSMASSLPPEAGQWFVMICFATVLNGSVFGDQCSPLSDTTILSAIVSGCELMEHVRTQLVPASVAGGLAMVSWTILTAWILR